MAYCEFPASVTMPGKGNYVGPQEETIVCLKYTIFAFNFLSWVRAGTRGRLFCFILSSFFSLYTDLRPHQAQRTSATRQQKGGNKMAASLPRPRCNICSLICVRT